MKILVAILIIVPILLAGVPALAQTYVEEEFVVEGEPVYTETVPRGTVVLTPSPVVVVPAEQDVYVGISRHHAVELLGPPAYVERFRGFTRRHHGFYDEVLTYATPTGNMVLFIREGRVQKIEYE